MTRGARLEHRSGVRFGAGLGSRVAIGAVVALTPVRADAAPVPPEKAGQTGAAESAGTGSHSAFPALDWIATQLVPSPEIAFARGAAHFGARWQVTPLLYSFGVHRGESPLRSFLVEPIVRHSGSLELYVSPEYLSITERGADRWFMRPGLRAYFPLVERGDYLSCSIGTSYAIAPTPNASGLGYEVGLYSLFGVLGVQVTYAPARLPVDWIATLSFRYF